MRPVDYSTLIEKRCSRCKKTKPVAAFNRYNDPSQPINGWRYYSRCIECNRADCRKYGAGNKPARNERLREWRRRNPEAARANDRRKSLKQNYGLTPGQVEALFAAQAGRCLICWKTKDLVVDHDHETGKVRGGLCRSCNTFLGRVEANPHILGAMASYLAAPCPGSRLLNLPGDFCHADVLLEVANEATT